MRTLRCHKMLAWIKRFFELNRRVYDMQQAMLKPDLEERHQAMCEVVKKHDPKRWAEIQREIAEGASGFLVTDGKTVQFNPIRREHAAVPVRKS